MQKLDFADPIRQAVINSSRTQYSIARDCWMSQSQLRRFVKGEQWFKEDVLNRLAAELGLRVVVVPSEEHRVSPPQ